jgi:type VI secretion system protein ImpE
MDAEKLFKAGKLSEAISALTSHLRDNPADLRSRTFLFELLCFSGDYDRAEKQLNILEQEGSKDSFLGTILYKSALHAERLRADMFERKTYPKHVVNGASTNVSGKLNGKEFTSLSDADPRVGDKLEIFAGGDYLWVSFHDVATLRIQAPQKLRDLIWAPAKLLTAASFRSRDLGEILIPVISPLSWQHPDEEVQLGRVTEWCEDDTGEVAPFGSKTWLIDGEEFPVLEVRELEIYPTPGAHVEDSPE